MQSERDREIDLASTRGEIVHALGKVIARIDKEIYEIQSYFSKGDKLKSDHLLSLDRDTLKERERHLSTLNNVNLEVIQVINTCSDNLPLKETKDHIQKIIEYYYLAYDKSKKCTQELNNFKNFATPYIKIL